MNGIVKKIKKNICKMLDFIVDFILVCFLLRSFFVLGCFNVMWNYGRKYFSSVWYVVLGVFFGRKCFVLIEWFLVLGYYFC